MDLKIICVFLFLIVSVIVFHSEFIGADTKSNNYKEFTNKTIIGKLNPDPNSLVEAYSNGAYLSSYSIPEANDLIIKDGNWTINKMSEQHPEIIEKIKPQDSKETFFVKRSILIDKGATLNILNSSILFKSLSSKDNNPAVLITYGRTNIINSTVKSWDQENNRPDPNPYHPRSFLVAKNGGQMNVIGSQISYLGFSLGGVHTLESSLAALDYYNTSQFIITNSTLDNNLYGFYSDESSKFKLIGNEIFANVGYGLDPHSGSKDFIIDSNHIFANGGQGIICSFRCKNMTVSNNIVEFNIEGIGLHWLTNSSIVKNNVVKYNKGYGIYIKTSSNDNILEHNSVLGNGNGIGLLDNSNRNAIKSNILIGNLLDEAQIHQDEDSQLNFIEGNNYDSK